MRQVYANSMRQAPNQARHRLGGRLHEFALDPHKYAEARGEDLICGARADRCQWAP